MAEKAMVTIPQEEYDELLKLKAELPSYIEKAKQEGAEEYKRMKLQKLHDIIKADPKAHAKKVLEKYHQNKEEINKRRRERYQAKKAATGSQAPQSSSEG